MKHLPRIAYSAGGGVLVTLLSFLFYREGGEFFAVPGIMIAGLIDLVAYLLSGPDEFPHIIAWEYCSVAFYFVVFYGVSSAFTAILHERQNTRKLNDEIQPGVGPERGSSLL